MTIKKRVLIAEDHALFRAGLRAMLNSEADLEIVGEVQDGKEAVRMATSLAPDLILMDLNMPGSHGLGAIAEIRKRVPDMRILVITMHKTDEYIQEALRNGASGYILKESGPDELLMAIRTVLGGKVYLTPDVSERVVSGLLNGSPRDTADATTPLDTLTSREREVLKLVAEGHGNKHIANYLNLSVKTVEKHRSSLMHKLNLRNAAMLTAFAISNRIISM
jgi:DNA-binding NarL/FixJ family response regulator